MQCMYQLSERKIKGKQGKQVTEPGNVIGVYKTPEEARQKMESLHDKECSMYIRYNSSTYFTCTLDDGSEYMLEIKVLREDGKPLIPQRDVDFIQLPNDGIEEDI